MRRCGTWTIWMIVWVCTIGQGAGARAQGERRDQLVFASGPAANRSRDAIVRALRLLPRLPSGVAIIDANEARPEVRSTLIRLDAFIVEGSTTVYVVRQSELLQGAERDSAFHLHALAAVLWHEMAHADGADEREARRREEALWRTFIRDQSVDAVTGLRYLSALLRR